MRKFTKEELENSKRIFKSATPKQDLSWYVKWLASIFILTAVVARSAGIEYHMIDVWFSFIGTFGWLCVGLLWKDRALIMLNAVIVTVLGQAIIRSLAGG
jgi:hypothetical protein